jgi:hypothetical protein
MEKHSFKIGQQFRDEHGETLSIIEIVEKDIDGYGTIYTSSSLKEKSIYTKINDVDSMYFGTIPFFLETFLEKVTYVQD